MSKIVICNPDKAFGVVSLVGGGQICPTILATDYKSPKLVIEAENEENPTDKHNR